MAESRSGPPGIYICRCNQWQAQNHNQRWILNLTLPICTLEIYCDHPVAYWYCCVQWKDYFQLKQQLGETLLRRLAVTNLILLADHASSVSLTCSCHTRVSPTIVEHCSTPTVCRCSHQARCFRHCGISRTATEMNDNLCFGKMESRIFQFQAVPKKLPLLPKIHITTGTVTKIACIQELRKSDFEPGVKSDVNFRI